MTAFQPRYGPNFFRLLLFIGGAAGLSTLSGSAHGTESIYTILNLQKCAHAPGTAEEDYGEWRCTGYAGIPIYVTAGDQRGYVSFGRKAKDEPAARQTLAAFNSPGSRIEWRLERSANGRAKPFAAIMRWSTTTSADDETLAGKVLVVTRLPPGPVCHVGYVDARVNLDAEALARNIADGHARKFRCGDDQPVVLGKKDPRLTVP